MKKFYKAHRFSEPKKRLLASVLRVVEQYRRLGYKMTLRQLYYQLVAGDIIPNKDSEYGGLSRLLKHGRMAGLVPWDTFEDRGREPKIKPDWETLPDLIDSAIAQFRLPRWDIQDNYLELWTEKDALTSVLWPITAKYHVPLVINKGYSSTSAIYEASRRLSQAKKMGKENIILYLGDHDPSGLDMDRDIKKRLGEFGVDVRFERVGLTIKQINQFNPPPNPAKLTDPRAPAYIDIHGEVSWEVDAIKPQELDRIVSTKIEGFMDMVAYGWAKEQEQYLKEILEDHKVIIEVKLEEENYDWRERDDE